MVYEYIDKLDNIYKLYGVLFNFLHYRALVSHTFVRPLLYHQLKFTTLVCSFTAVSKGFSMNILTSWTISTSFMMSYLFFFTTEHW